MRTQLSKVLIIALAISITAAADIPKYCAEEVIALSKGNNFDVQKFISDLPIAVGKAKLQAKAPFGKPKDSDKTDIGMTFGCLKAFPESPAEIQPLLKNFGLGVAKSIVANKLGTANEENNIGATSVIADKQAAVNRFSQTYANAANNANFRSAPALKECDAVFNPAKKFCYDGGIYDLCDGMSYNPTTHICSGDIANRALCNGTQYNPLKQKCENNIIFSVCGKTTYNPTTHGCKDNAVFVLSKCGVVTYDPKTFSCEDNVLFPKCGEILYDPKTHVCKKNMVLARCGEDFYDPITQTCKDNVVLTRCGENFYDPKTHDCKDNVMVAFPKCGTTEIPYNPAKQGCKDNVVLAKCGTTIYYPAQQICRDNVVFTRCGATEFYNPKTQTCSYGAVFEK